VTEDIPVEETSLDESTTEDESTTKDESGDEEEFQHVQFLNPSSMHQVYKEYAIKGRFEIKRGRQHNDVRIHRLKKAKTKYFYYVREGQKISNLNMGPVRVFKLMKEIYSGFENIGATTTDCKNEIRDMNVFVGEDDAQMVVDKLLSKQEFFHDFFVSYKTDENDASTGLFWADEEAKRNYLFFGDVVSFDATYRSNKYNMVLVLMWSP
ncbi:FAR1-related sequence 5-like protein, partial [Tanacetum coccineum]